MPAKRNAARRTKPSPEKPPAVAAHRPAPAPPRPNKKLLLASSILLVTWLAFLAWLALKP